MLLAVAAAFAGVSGVHADEAAQWSAYSSNAAPFLAKYCQDCHTKDDPLVEIKFDVISDSASLNSHLVELEKAVRMLNFKLMPPSDQPQPSEEERAKMVAWIRGFLRDVNRSLPRTPGRVTARRLNRTEYDNTIRDLLGISFNTTTIFPEDNTGYGFDNNGDVLSVAPVLMEKYLESAELVLDRALFVEPIAPPPVVSHDATKMDGSVPLTSEAPPAAAPPAGRAGRRGRGPPPSRVFPYQGEIHFEQEFPESGTYVVRIRAYKSGPRAQVALLINGEKAGDNVAIQEDQRNTGYYAFKPQFITKGKHTVAISFANGPTREQYEAAQKAAAEAEAAAAAAANPPVEQPAAEAPAEQPPAAQPAADQPPAAQPPADQPPARGARGAGRRGAAGRGGRGGAQAGTLGVLFVEVEGPLEPPIERMPPSFGRVMALLPSSSASKQQAAEATIERFTERAFRRPLREGELERLMARWEAFDAAGEDFAHSINYTLQAVLISPHFLFRIEGEPQPGEEVYVLNEYELATRLSYFLWNTMPDEELFREAAAGTLRQNLDVQVARMLKDPKSDSLVSNFAGQWLQLRGLYTFTPNDKVFPQWDEALRQAIVKETELCFAEVLRNGQSVLNLLDANYTFLNERLARHYGIEGIEGEEFRKVELTDNRRGGLLTQASFLTLTSYPDRTSPVKRGKWVLETLLATPPPDPPPGIPALAEQPLLVGTLREKLEQHRENPNCAACHALMDPIGFGLENFDAIGQWRQRDGDDAIEPSGVLPTGEAFDGPAQLRKALLNQSAQLTRCLSEQMLVYALGRGLERTDQVYLDEISEEVTKSGHRLDALISQIVHSDPFQKRSQRGVE